MGNLFFVSNTDKFERNDIAVFENYSDDYMSPIEEEPGKWKKKWMRMVYRMVAYSGDNIELRDGDLYINGTNIPPPPSSKTEYEMRAKHGPLTGMDEEQLSAAQVLGKADTAIYMIELTYQKAEELRKNPAVFSVKRKIYPRSINSNYEMAESSAVDDWTLDNYGPIKIPAPGEKIVVTTANLSLYKNIPGIEKPGEYTIKEKLYFMLGDNRHAAMDSRFIGFISHSKMIGIVKMK